MTTLRISQLAERSGVPATTLRFYETAGLLPAGRTPAGYRVYGEDAVERLSFIGAAKRLGLPLDEIAELLPAWASGPCTDVKAGLRPRVADRLAEAERRIAELTAFTGTLRRALAHLDALPDRDGRCDAECGCPAPAARTDAVPVACSLTDREAGERVEHWRRLVAGADREPIEDGVRLTLPAGDAGELAALAADEQRCCPFFDFRLHLAGPEVHLEVRAPADAAPVITELFGPPQTRAAT